MIEIPNWVVQVAAVWFLLEKVALFEKRTKEWANRRAYEKARKENEEAFDAGYEDVYHVPPDQFPTYEEWLTQRDGWKECQRRTARRADQAIRSYREQLRNRDEFERKKKESARIRRKFGLDP